MNLLLQEAAQACADAKRALATAPGNAFPEIRTLVKANHLLTELAEQFANRKNRTRVFVVKPGSYVILIWSCEYETYQVEFAEKEPAPLTPAIWQWINLIKLR